MRHVLALVQPLRADGTRVDVRATSADLAHFTGLGGFDWEPAISSGLRVSQRVFGGDFSERGASASSANLSLAMQVIKETYPDASELDWSGAPVTLYQGQEGDAWPLDAFFKGVVRSYRGERNTLTLTCAVDAEPFEADLPSASYAGTTGTEGGADLEGTVKPLVLGHAQNVEPVAIDLIDNVYQFSAYGPIEAVTTLYERGSSFGASVGDFANYAALVAANIDEGRWGTCLAEGLIRLGAPAFGVITGDVRGHEVSGVTPRLPGAMIAALADLAGVSASLIEGGTLTALDADKPYPMSLVLTEARDFLSIAREIGAACNHIVGVGLTGQLFAQKIGIGANADITLDAQGKAWPQVISSQEESTSPPYSKVMLGAAPSWRVHTTDEIAFQAEIVDRGAYSASTWYRDGSITETENGARWLYINTEPGSGNAPPTWPTTSNAHWTILSGPPQVSFADVVDDGTKPAANATRNPGATGGANLVRFPSGQDMFDDWFNGIAISTDVPPGATAEDRSVEILDAFRQRPKNYAGNPAGKRFKFKVWLKTLGHFGGDVSLRIRDSAAFIYPQTLLSGTDKLAADQDWTYLECVIQIEAGGTANYTDYTPAMDLVANVGAAPKVYDFVCEEIPIVALSEVDPAQDGKLNSVEENATEGATWGGDITNQPSDAALLNENQEWSDLNSGPASDAFQRALALGTMNVGGGGNIRFLKNVNSTGAGNVGEIRVLGDRFLHPDGTNRSITDEDILTAYEGSSSTGQTGTFYVIYTDTELTTRFPGFDYNRSNFFVATYNEITGQWTARDNVHTAFNFTPVDSDCIVAVGTRFYPSTGITTLYSFLSADGNLYEPGATEGATWNNNIGGQPTSLAGLDPLQNSKLNGIEGGAQVNPANLAELDPAARAELDAASGQTRLTAGFQQIINRSLVAGGTNSMTAQLVREAGGNSGTINARIQYRELGASTWITLATGPGSVVSASEPGADNVSTTFTNNTGAKRAFQFRMTEVRSPSSAGGNQVAAETFLEA